MRARRSSLFLAALVLVSVLQSGCGLAKQLTTNLVCDPLHWDRYSDAIGRHIRDKSLAEEAWDEVCSRDGDVYSRHYRRGFFEGFDDYMDNGGSGEPPTLPPRTYWRVYYQTPEGHDAIQDWFEGFRHGASVARASGLRNYVTVPVSSVPPKETIGEEQSAEELATGKSEKIPAPGTTKPGTDKPGTDKPGTDKEGPVKPPVTPPKTADGRPMPPPAPPIIQVERMIAPPIPNKNPNPRP